MRYVRQCCAGVLFKVIAATFVLLPQVANLPAHAAPKGADASLIEQHIVAQQGLSLGLATMLLQSQWEVQNAIGLTVGQCFSPLGSGWGGIEELSQFNTGQAFGGHLRLYFDTACTQIYMDEKVRYRVRSFSPLDLVPVATIAVYSRSGRKTGTFELSGRVLGATSETHLRISATATFSPRDGSPQATVAFTCEIPPTEVDGALDVPCGDGIAQDFPVLGISTASVNPVILHMVTSSGITSITFKQDKRATLYTGALGALSVSVNPRNKIVLTGDATPYGADKIAGKAALWGLFPPRPTQWTINDAGHDADFSIALRSDLTRKLTGTITSSAMSTPLATMAIDQSGTGRISYSDGTTANVSSWIIAK